MFVVARCSPSREWFSSLHYAQDRDCTSSLITATAASTHRCALGALQTSDWEAGAAESIGRAFSCSFRLGLFSWGFHSIQTKQTYVTVSLLNLAL